MISYERIRQSYFLSQPHQGFFLFGVLWAVVSMILFALMYRGAITSTVSPVEIHVYALVFLVFTQVFHGFLFTTMPRFCATAPIPAQSYRPVILFYQLAAILFFIGSVMSIWLMITAVFIAFGTHLFALFMLEWVYQISHTPDRSDPLWILIAMRFGAVGHLIWLLGVLAQGFETVDSIPSLLFEAVLYLYLFFVTFVVAQRMIPFFSHAQPRKTAYAIPILLAAVLLKTVSNLLGCVSIEALITLAMGLFVLREVLRWNLRPFQAPAIVWVLHLALLWLPLGLILDALVLGAGALGFFHVPFLGVHLIGIGFLTTMLIGFGTRVTLGHSGRPPFADAWAVTLFISMQAIVLLRALLSFFPQHLWLFDAAALGWVLLFVLWGVRYGRILIFKQILRR